GRGGDGVDTVDEPDQPLVAIASGGREADPAVAEDQGGDAVPARRRQVRIPGRLAVVVRVHVDEAGRDDEAPRVERVARRSGHDTHGGDPGAVDGDVGAARGIAGPGDGGAAG